MALIIGCVAINVSDVEQAKRFWTAALGYEVRHADPTFAVLSDPNRLGVDVFLQLWLQPKHGRNRLHLDLFPDDQAREVQRLETLGAVRLAWNYPPDADYIVMADLDGNEFCVVASTSTRD